MTKTIAKIVHIGNDTASVKCILCSKSLLGSCSVNKQDDIGTVVLSLPEMNIDTKCEDVDISDKEIVTTGIVDNSPECKVSFDQEIAKDISEKLSRLFDLQVIFNFNSNGVEPSSFDMATLTQNIISIVRDLMN